MLDQEEVAQNTITEPLFTVVIDGSWAMYIKVLNSTCLFPMEV